jgi:hypothetical protein
VPILLSLAGTPLETNQKPIKRAAAGVMGRTCMMDIYDVLDRMDEMDKARVSFYLVSTLPPILDPWAAGAENNCLSVLAIPGV